MKIICKITFVHFYFLTHPNLFAMIYRAHGNLVNDAKILMRCQTSHLYKLQPSVSTHCTQFCTFTKIQFTKFTIVNTTFTSNSHPPVYMIELTYSSDMNSVMDEVKVWGINHIWKFSNVWMFNFWKFSVNQSEYGKN